MFYYLVSDVFEAHAGSVKGSSLLCVAHPEADVVKAVKDANLRLA